MALLQVVLYFECRGVFLRAFRFRISSDWKGLIGSRFAVKIDFRIPQLEAIAIARFFVVHAFIRLKAIGLRQAFDQRAINREVLAS